MAETDKKTTAIPEARALRWTCAQMGGVDQEKGFPRTAAMYCLAGAEKIERQDAAITELSSKLTDEVRAHTETLKRMKEILTDLHDYERQVQKIDENNPLTEKEIHNMVGDPVWCDIHRKWGIVGTISTPGKKDTVIYFGTAWEWLDDVYKYNKGRIYHMRPLEA